MSFIFIFFFVKNDSKQKKLSFSNSPAHRLLVLVGRAPRQRGPERRRDRRGLLHQHQRARDQRALPDEVDGVVEQRRERVEGRASAAARAADAERHRGAVAHVRVERLRQRGDGGRDALGTLSREHETEVEHRGAAHVVADVADRRRQQPPDGGRRGGAREREARRERAAVAEERVRVGRETLDEVGGEVSLAKRAEGGA